MPHVLLPDFAGVNGNSLQIRGYARHTFTAVSRVPCSLVLVATGLRCLHGCITALALLTTSPCTCLWCTARLLNVTAPPANIDNTGKTDVTWLLQYAITLAHANGLVVYLPLGTYLVSDTLTAYDPNPGGYPAGENNTFPCRFSPNVMIGERAPAAAAGRPLQRPVIRLADNAKGFQGGPGCGGSGGSRPVVCGCACARHSGSCRGSF